NDRSGDELREIRYEKCVFRESVAGAGRLIPDVTEVGDLLERVERNADGEDDVGQIERRVSQQGGDRFQKEQSVFVISEHREIGGDTHSRENSPRLALGPVDQV